MDRETIMILILEYFEFENIKRMDELKHCFILNTSSKIFDRIIIFTQLKNNHFLKELSNCEIVEIENRITYQFIFDYCNNMKSEDIFILSNSDILFDYTIHQTRQIKENDFYCISRYEIKDNVSEICQHPFWSQDVWIWKNNCRISNANFNMGVQGCDNRIANEAKLSGYNLLNPSLSLICKHYHFSEFRTHSDDNRIKGEYTYVEPNDITDSKTEIKDFNYV